MNVSLRWLRDLAPSIEGSPAELSDHLAARGFPVEGMEELAEGLSGIRVGRVLSVRSHPNADRLRVCEVDGGDGVVQVVCGAENVAGGRLYPFAPVGSALPGGMSIGKVKLRGEVSEGMLCSEKELGLGPGAAGLMELEGEPEAGTPLVEVLGLDDVRLDVEVTSNRPDMLSHEGVARELTPGGHEDLRLPEIPNDDPSRAVALESLETIEGNPSVSGGGVRIRIEAPDMCSRYLGLVVEGVQVGPSPLWLQERLRAAGARPVNNVVDATNYVLLELGQPLHAFDLDKVRGREVVVRRARTREPLRTLDGVERTLPKSVLAICDAEGPMAAAGIMGGEESEVSDQTTKLLLECALFTPGHVRAGRKELGLSTDASYRFERGVDPEGMLRALERTVRIVLATAGGAISGPLLDCRAGEAFRRTSVRLRPERVHAVLGVDFDTSAIRALLRPLGFAIAEDGEELLVEVPGFRSYDVKREIDLIEEIARTYGYDEFPEELNAFRPSSVPDHPLFELEERIRRELIGIGMLEAQTPAFAREDGGEVELLNPVSSEERWLRSSILPAMVRRLEYNLARGNRDVRLFEIGTAFSAGGPGSLPAEETRVAGVLHGSRSPAHWTGSGGDFDVWDLKGLLERMAVVLPSGPWRVEAMDTGTAGEFGLDGAWAFSIVSEKGERAGFGGRVASGRVDLPPWAGPVWGFEASLPERPVKAAPVTYRPLPVHPGVERDLALLLPGDVNVARVLELGEEHGGEHLVDIGVFDVYRDEHMPPGTRSVAVRLRFRASDRTLKDSEVDAAMQKITRILQGELRVEFRGSGD
jgi:phenylalanyl-tRNA synthetase beta chain